MREGTIPYFANIQVKACASCISVTDYCRCKYVRIHVLHKFWTVECLCGKYVIGIDRRLPFARCNTSEELTLTVCTTLVTCTSN
mmetsp:Transcript_16611/g.26655  ORF Transcript_16611/g.26655 Transcript_16611/m.26655 type:complete len:84 (-) Transcript_16611:139-390(-)